MDESAWPEVSEAIAAAPYPVKVLPAEPGKASARLAALEITTRSWLGAVVANTGGLLVDHGWLRVLGCGHDKLPDVVAESDPQTGVVAIGYDIMGGQFAWLQRQPGVRPTMHGRSVQFRHRYGLGTRLTGATLDGILDDQTLGAVPRLGPVYHQQVRPESRVVLAQSPGTEPARPTRSLSTEPTEHPNS